MPGWAHSPHGHPRRIRAAPADVRTGLALPTGGAGPAERGQQVRPGQARGRAGGEGARGPGSGGRPGRRQPRQGQRGAGPPVAAGRARRGSRGSPAPPGQAAAGGDGARPRRALAGQSRAGPGLLGLSRWEPAALGQRWERSRWLGQHRQLPGKRPARLGHSQAAPEIENLAVQSGRGRAGSRLNTERPVLYAKCRE